MKVVHVITGLPAGGAEHSLLKVASNLKQHGIQSLVVQLADPSTLRSDFESAGVEVVNLNLGGVADLLSAVSAIRGEVERFGADCLDCWMYYANALSVIAYAGRKIKPRIIWNIRQSFAGVRREKLPVRIALTLNRLGSRLPDHIVYNSFVARAEHEQIGFSSLRSLVIPNGVDIEEFRPAPSLREQIRAELDINEGKAVVGMFARFVPRKGFENFMEAARLLLRERADLQFLVAGEGVSLDNPEFIKLCDIEGLRSRITVLGVRRDMPALVNACDVVCLPAQFGEGLPNVVMEAMATGVACVVTDSGDASELVGATGRVVPVGDSQETARACLELLELRAANCDDVVRACRSRIADKYCINKMTESFCALYHQ